jgi:transposase InsO family protein
MKNLRKKLYYYNILALVECGLLTGVQAAHQLHVSERHIRRLLRTFRKHGKSWKKLVPHHSTAVWNGTPQSVVDEVVRLKQERPQRSNQHIAELVKHTINHTLSVSTVRNILIKHDCYQHAQRERRSFSRLENHITKSGQMLQMDTCEGAWLAGYRRVYLIAVMDAYSRYLVGYQWVDTDSAWNNILVLRSVITQYGVPELLYTDNASFFKVIRHDKSIYQRHKPQDEYETTIARIMRDLGAALITHKPYEPQGKGRIERFFQFMQSRFIGEHTAPTLEELNTQFARWLVWYHTKHVIKTIGCAPKDRFNPNGFKPIPEDLNLERIFSYQYTRKIDKYNSFTFEGNRYSIDSRIGCFVAFTVELFVTDKTIAVYHSNSLVQTFEKLSKNQK